MKQGAHTYHGRKVDRANRLLSKLGPLAKIRREVWLSVFPSDPALTASAITPKPKLIHRASA